MFLCMFLICFFGPCPCPSPCLNVCLLYRLWKPVCQNTLSPTGQNYQATSGGGLKRNFTYNTTNLSQSGRSSNWNLNLKCHLCHSTIWYYSKTEVMEVHQSSWAKFMLLLADQSDETEEFCTASWHHDYLEEEILNPHFWKAVLPAYRHPDKDKLAVPGHTNAI